MLDNYSIKNIMNKQSSLDRAYRSFIKSSVKADKASKQIVNIIDTIICKLKTYPVQ